ERVTKRAYGMVAYLGMSSSLANLCYYNTQGEYNFTKPYSEKTSEKIDAEVSRLIDEQYARAKQLLSEHAAQHAELAQLLVDREVIFTEDVEHIFGPRPWRSRADVLMEEEALKLADERAKRLAKEKDEQGENGTDQAEAPAEHTESEDSAQAPAAPNTKNQEA
ncbi:MAG: cell division protein FtsH, partial [Alloprevotella sp.]